MQGQKAIHLVDQNFATATVAQMFSQLRDGGYLSEKDVKSKSITLRVEIFDVEELVRILLVHPWLMVA
jgi:hypothetical protein